MAESWRVDFKDKDDDRVQTASFASKQDADNWISHQEQQDRYDPSGFEVVDGPYQSSKALASKKAKVWVDAELPALDGFQQVKSLDEFVYFFASVVKKLEDIGIVSFGDDVELANRVLSWLDSHGAPASIQVHFHGEDRNAQDAINSLAKSFGYGIVSQLHEIEDQKHLDEGLDMADNAKSIKIWVDDIRPAPNGYVWLKSVNDFIDWMVEHGLQDVLVIDLDHDAGDYASDGGDYIKCLDWLESVGAEDVNVRVHSANPVGIAKMRQVIKKNGWTEVFDIYDSLDEQLLPLDEQELDEAGIQDQKLEVPKPKKSSKKKGKKSGPEDTKSKRTMVDKLKDIAQEFKTKANNNDPEQFAKITVAFDDLASAVGDYDFKEKKVLNEVDGNETEEEA